MEAANNLYREIKLVRNSMTKHHVWSKIVWGTHAENTAIHGRLKFRVRFNCVLNEETNTVAVMCISHNLQIA